MGERRRWKKIVAAVSIATDYRSHLNYTLLEMGFCLRDVGTKLTWLDVADIIEHSPVSSPVKQAIMQDDDLFYWISGTRTQDTLADIVDSIQALHHTLVSVFSKQKPKPLKPYPRPWQQDTSGKTRIIGKEAVSISDFEEFWQA